MVAATAVLSTTKKSRFGSKLSIFFLLIRGDCGGVVLVPPTAEPAAAAAADAASLSLAPDWLVVVVLGMVE